MVNSTGAEQNIFISFIPIITAVVAVLGTLLGTFLNNRYNLKKEENLAKIELEKKKIKNNSEENREKINQIRTNYLEVLLAISEYLVHHKDASGKSTDSKLEIETDKVLVLHRAVTKFLSFNYNKELEDLLGYFLHFLGTRYVENIRDIIFKMAIQNNISENLLIVDQNEKRKLDYDEKILNINIDSNFIKEQIINHGNMITGNYRFTVNIKKLSREQRKYLIMQINDVYMSNFFLAMPISKYGDELFNYNTWQAKIDPSNSSIEDILNAWENDFSSALIKLNNPTSNP